MINADFYMYIASYTSTHDPWAHTDLTNIATSDRVREVVTIEGKLVDNLEQSATG